MTRVQAFEQIEEPSDVTLEDYDEIDSVLRQNSSLERMRVNPVEAYGTIE